MQSLKKKKHFFADTLIQLEVLNQATQTDIQFPAFTQKLREAHLFPLKSRQLEVFQVNIGKMCNQVCRHCHVDAGPDRKEIMTRETMQYCLDALAQTTIRTVD